MQFGKHLRELFRLRLGVGLSLVLGVLVALNNVYNISVDPPGVKPRHLEIGAASTHVLVDLKHSAVTDVHAKGGTLSDLTLRAGLLGNIMASAPVRAYIGRIAGVDPNRIEAVAPVTANVPRAFTEPGSEKRASDILKSTEQYRLDIQSNPTVPVLNIYAQAPTADAARRLADGAVQGLQGYLSDLARRQRIAEDAEVSLIQLGRAQGGVINKGIDVQIAILSFLVVFGLGCCVTLLVVRVRVGW
jgi:hypothetical protein